MSTAEQIIPAWVSSLRLYLDDDDRTVGVLVPPMQERMRDVYEDFRRQHEKDAGAEMLMSNSELMGFLTRLV